MDKQSLKELKDATSEDRRLAEEVEREERKQGIPHPQEETKKK